MAAVSRRERRSEAADAAAQVGCQLLAGEVLKMVTDGCAFSNTKAKRELGWELRYPSWRQGFKDELA